MARTHHGVLTRARRTGGQSNDPRTDHRRRPLSRPISGRQHAPREQGGNNRGRPASARPKGAAGGSPGDSRSPARPGPRAAGRDQARQQNQPTSPVVGPANTGADGRHPRERAVSAPVSHRTPALGRPHSGRPHPGADGKRASQPPPVSAPVSPLPSALGRPRSDRPSRERPRAGQPGAGPEPGAVTHPREPAENKPGLPAVAGPRGQQGAVRATAGHLQDPARTGRVGASTAAEPADQPGGWAGRHRGRRPAPPGADGKCASQPPHTRTREATVRPAIPRAS